jgi:predicted adenylyl cyclase CyaB
VISSRKKRGDKMVELEVETKVKLSNKEAVELRKKIKKIANFKKKESRTDDYFAIKRKGYPKKAFRIRKAGGEYVVNFKKWLTAHWDRQIVVKEEYEFKTQHPDKFLVLMDDLGFKQWLKKFKTTEKYTYKKDKRVIIEINFVKHLGYFMEMEYIAKPSEMMKGKNKLRGVLKELGIKQSQVTNKGYTKMLWDIGKRGRKYFIDID